jgi:hypothetical protein
MLSIPIIDHMRINIGDAVRMYARLLRGSIRDAKVALAVAICEREGRLVWRQSLGSCRRTDVVEQSIHEPLSQTLGRAETSQPSV